MKQGTVIALSMVVAFLVNIASWYPIRDVLIDAGVGQTARFFIAFGWASLTSFLVVVAGLKLFDKESKQKE